MRRRLLPDASLLRQEQYTSPRPKCPKRKLLPLLEQNHCPLKRPSPLRNAGDGSAYPWQAHAPTPSSERESKLQLACWTWAMAEWHSKQHTRNNSRNHLSRCFTCRFCRPFALICGESIREA